jgi:predicted membrane channel-forming protein YqfA (hemolysin III family)
MTGDQPQPSWRKPVGMFAILAIIAIWGGIIATFAAEIGQWPRAVQALFYIVAGIIWIFPVRPLLVWMELGRWRA